MRGYGLPRNDDVQNPDVSDIQLYGLRGHGHRFHKAQTKANARRVWKKIERNNAKREIKNEV